MRRRAGAATDGRGGDGGVDFLVLQALGGLASASSLFLVASGLSIIFGVTRIVNFAHGSLYMLGAYLAWSLAGVVGFWAALPLAALAVAVLGAVLEMGLLRRVYAAPELFQLLATFGVVLIVEDAVVALWGPADLLGPRAPGLEGAVTILGQPFPAYDLLLIAVGPLVLAALWLLFNRTRWGILVRAATHDRAMVAALGVDQRWLFTSVFVLGALLAGLGGALQLPREPAHHAMDLAIIVEAFVVVVIGGLGSVPGAFLAAVLIGELNAFGILVFPRITLVLAFLVMAVVLVVRPWGLLGRPEPEASGTAAPPPRPLGPWGQGGAALVLAALAMLPWWTDAYGLAVATEILVWALFAASLHLLIGVGGMLSFGHAAYFGLGAYGAALAMKHLAWPMEAAVWAGPLLAAAGALVFGWFCVRRTGVYMAMLTLAFAQVVWAVAFQWYEVTGGDNGLLGLWPSPWASDPAVLYAVVLALVALAVLALRRVAFAPFGATLRASRDAPARARAIGIDVTGHRWLAFILAGGLAGLAGALFAVVKGSVFPDVASVAVSVDGLLMVLLGGVDSLLGPLVGAGVFQALRIELASLTDLWKLALGVLIVVLVLAFPQGIAGFVAGRLDAWRAR